MILQTLTGIFILSVALICDVTGASYSNVYVESEVVPMGYYSYGTPYPSIANPSLSQINSLPSVPGYVAPCVSPCVYPAQTLATVAPVHPSPNVLTYNAPSVPIVVAPTKQESTGYEYSYVVYDENTGDHKSQRELSDGSVVRGEYSFLQPDGYIRQVQYVADDISGFNAVVKQFLPAAVESHRKVGGQENKETSPPCHEIKNESLIEESEADSREISIKKNLKVHGMQHNEHFNEESTEKSKEHHSTSKESGEEKKSKEKNHKEAQKVSKEESGNESVDSHENHSKKPNQSKEASGEASEEKTKEKAYIKPKHSKGVSGEESKEKHHNKSNRVSSEDSGVESEENSQEETLHKKSKESTGESKEKHHKKAKKESKESGEESEEETDSEESKEELKETSRKKTSKGTDESKEKNKNKSKKGVKEESDKDSGEESEEVGHGKHKEVHALLKPNQEGPYNDILKCIEAAMRRNYGVPAAMRQEPSPLTYIILNKPC